MSEISFNVKDEQLPKIKAATKSNGMNTTYSYRVYGLKDDKKNPAVLIQTNTNVIADKEYENIVAFFNKNKIKAVFKHVGAGEKKQKHQVYIGLKPNIRGNHKVSASVIDTVVHGLEGKLKVVKSKKVNCPEFD